MENFYDIDIEVNEADYATEQPQNDFVLLPNGTYPFTIEKVEFLTYRPKEGKTTGITKSCKQIKVSMIIDGGDKGKSWVDENLFFYPSTMFKIFQVFKSVGLIGENFKGVLPWNELKSSSGLAEIETETYTNKNNEGKQRNRIKKFIKSAMKSQPVLTKEELENMPF